MRLAGFYILFVLMSLSCTARGQSPPASAEASTSLFDPQRHMRVAEVRPGMTGYGLSVFQGTEIERFNVEVISVLHNFNPKYDVILIRCQGANLEHTGAIAGMSGSPIYLTDEQGRSRMVGAFAYGWPLMKDPLAGVQPIEYMLEVGSTLRPEPAATQQSGTFNTRTNRPLFQIDPNFDPLASPSIPELLRQTTPLTGNQAPQLQPLATPLMSAGLSPRVMRQFASMLREYGLVTLQAGGGSAPATAPAPEIEPGSVLAAPLLTGDVELTAIGTCTEVVGDRIFGFGHPFNNEGPITLPMGAGQINGIIANLSQSFKLGAMTQLKGTLIADQVVGVAGRLGKSPPTIPIDVRVSYTDGSLDAHYHFDAAAHPRLTPLLGTIALVSAMSGQRDLPQYHTASYDLKLEFANGRTLDVRDVAVNSAAPALVRAVALPVTLASENPFERVMLKRISGTIRVAPEAQEADILSVSLPKQKYRPGETLKAFVRYRPFRAGEALLPIEMTLPHDLSDGTYQFSVSDQKIFLQQEQVARPFRFSTENIDEVFEVLREIGETRANAIYIRLMRQPDGVAIGRTALPSLPSSRRQVLLEAGRSNVTPFVSAAIKVVPTETVINGSADFQIEIDAGQRVEVGGPRGSRPEPQPPAPGGTSAPKPAPSSVEPAPAPSTPIE